MSKQEIWVTDEKRFVAKNLFCDHCGKEILTSALLFEGYSTSKNIKSNIIIIDEKHKEEGESLFNACLYNSQQLRRISIVNELPNNCFLYTYPLPSISESKRNLSVYEAGTMSLSGEKVFSRQPLISSYSDRNKTIDFDEHQKLLEDQQE